MPRDLCTSFEFDTVTNSYQRPHHTALQQPRGARGQWVVEGDRGNLEAEFPTPCDVSADVQQPKPDEYYCEPFDPRTGYGGVAALVPWGTTPGAPGALLVQTVRRRRVLRGRPDARLPGGYVHRVHGPLGEIS